MKILCICLSATIQRTLCFDKLVTGSVNRSQSFIENASGKAINTARVLNQLKNNCATVLCPVGKANKKRFLQLSAINNLKIKPVYTEGNTRECWTLLNKDGTTTEIVADENSINAKAPEEKFLKALKKELKNADGVIFAGSTPKIWNSYISSIICQTVKNAGKTLLADFCGINLLNTLKICTPDIIKINEQEFFNTFGIDAIPEKIAELSGEYKNIIIVTRGPAETYAGISGKSIIHPTRTIKAVNTTACGDSFNAGFMFEYLQSGNALKAMELGAECGAKNGECLTPGSLV